MQAFASAEDLEKRFRPLDEAEKSRAAYLLEDCTALILAEFARDRKTINKDDENQARLLKSVACEMVKRVLLSDINTLPVVDSATTAGPYSERFTFANPTGDLYITKQERKRLGLGAQRLGSICPQLGGGDIYP